MKKLQLIIALVLFSFSGAFAQVAYNPFTQNIHFAPEPTAQGYECGTTPQVIFTMGLTTADDATQFNAQPLGIIICVGGFTFKGTDIGQIISGSYAANFNWEIDNFSPNCLVGTQKNTLPGTGFDPLNPNPLASGDIIVNLKVPETSPIAQKLSVNVNLQIPGYMTATNSGPDDNESTETQTFCPLRIAGTVYYDTSNTDNTIYTPGGGTVYNPNNVQLYANLVDNDNFVIGVTPIDTNGNYEFLNLTPNRNYYVVLSTTPGTLGTNPPTTQLPGTWVNTGEACCNKTGTDGNPDGNINVPITNFSKYNVDFGIYIPNPTGPLPVVIKNFYLAEHNCTGILTWTTSSEINVQRIEVLRRETGKDFEVIATMNPAGGSTVEHTYTFTDSRITSGASYDYQIRFVDFDTKINLSSVQTLTAQCGKNDASINVFPNPVEGEMSVLYVCEEDNYTLEMEVLDVAGRKVITSTSTVNKGNNVVHINTSRLAKGNYFLRYRILDNAEQGSVKFLKK